MLLQTNKQTGVPSVDKPWTQFYSKEEMNVKIPAGTMFDYLYDRNKSYQNDIAYEYYGKKTTYKAFFSQIEQCCRNLSKHGVKKGDIVTIQSIPLPQVIVLMYALNRIGACGNMLYPDVKAEEIVSSMRKTNSHMFFVVDKIFETYENDFPKSFSDLIVLLNVADQMSLVPRLISGRKAAYKRLNQNLNTITWEQFINNTGEKYRENHDGNIPAFMLRTGGTTGVPKEVVLDSRGFNAIAEATYYSSVCKGWIRQKVSLLLQPPFIAFGVSSGVHHSLSYGIKLVIAVDVSPTSVSKLLSKYKPNYIVAGTMQIEQYMNDLGDRMKLLDYIDLLAIGGEAINASFEEKIQNYFRKRQCPVLPVKGYGLTETSGSVIAETMDTHKSGSVGIPLALCNMKIIDPDTGEELTYNKPGEVCLSSPGIMHEYYQNREATDQVIEVVNNEKWLHTGDIGFISEEGILTITGRIKRIITCREGLIYHKVFPLLIENQLAKVSGVQEITVVGKPSEETGNSLVAFVVPTHNNQYAEVEKNLKKYCDTNLESFERPKEYYYMEALPRTLIGKVNYRELEEIAKNRQNRL